MAEATTTTSKGAPADCRAAAPIPRRHPERTVRCAAVWLYLVLVVCVMVYFFVENYDASKEDGSSHGLERIFNLAAPATTDNSIYAQGETQTQPKDEATAIAIAQSNEAKKGKPRSKSGIVSNEEDSHWPHWLGKYAFMPLPEEVADENRICFVHVGKTAGSTMACELGFAYEGCPVDHIQLHRGNLARFTTSMMHKSYDRCAEHTMARYLFVVRDPFTRMQSWFTYERPVPGQKIWDPQHYASKLELFVDCPFDTLDALGGPEGLGGARNATHCAQNAWQAVTGERGFAVHNYFHYQRYLNKVLRHAQTKPPPIVVLRTEHLEQDWRRVEMDVLGGPEPFDGDPNFTFPHKHPSDKMEKDRYVSEESTRNICQALCHEIQVYKYILMQAENLDRTDYDESMKLLAQRCPVEAANARCEEQ